MEELSTDSVARFVDSAPSGLLIGPFKGHKNKPKNEMINLKLKYGEQRGLLKYAQILTHHFAYAFSIESKF